MREVILFAFLHFSMLLAFNKGEMSLCRGHGSGTGKGGCGGRAVNLPGWGRRQGGGGEECVCIFKGEKGTMLRFWRS